MANINPILQPAGTTTLRSYQHASRIFVDDNFRLSPKYGFLFYVEFDFNPLITSLSNLTAQEMGMIVKAVTLPKFSIETKTHNAYNRVNLVQNKIKYDPVTISFHDDQSDNIRNFWYDYYSFYYRDPDYADSTYTAPHKYQSRPAFDWGYTPRATVGYNNANGNQPYQYIQAIRIYSLYQKNFSECELINPMITRFAHGDHTQSENQGILSHEMTVQYETVKYYTGYTTADTTGGYVDLHYDNTPSPIAPAGGTNLINQDGTITVASNQITDLAMTTASLSQLAPFMFGGSTVQSGTSSVLATATTLASQTAQNAGGFSIPSLGSLTGASVNTSATLNQQLIATTAGTAGAITSQAANSVIGGISTGLGTNGSTLVGLAASAISNPSLVLSTVENMALGYATSYVSGVVQAQASQALSTVGTSISTAVSDSGIGQTLSGISSSISSGVSDLTNALGLTNASVNLFASDATNYAASLASSVDSFAEPVTSFSDLL